MIIPFIGIFFSLTLWGTFFQVPGFTDPNEGFFQRLSGAMRATVLTKGVYHLVEVISTYTLPAVNKKTVYVPLVVPDAPLDRVDLLDFNETGISVVIPLWEEPEEQSSASNSPNSSLDVVLVLAWGLLAFVFLLLWKGLVPSDAYTLGDILDKVFADTPKVAHYLVVGEAPSLYEEMDALTNGSVSSEGSPTSSESTAASLKQEVFDLAILRQVEEAISRLERQRLLAVIPELACILNGLPNGAKDSLMDATQDVLDADDSSVHRLPRQWALVVRRPENLSAEVVYKLVCTLVRSWESHTAALGVTVSPGQQATEQVGSDAENASVSAGGRRRRYRPSQAKRRSQAKRALRERQDEANAQAAAPHPAYSAPPVPTQHRAPIMAEPPMVPHAVAVYHQPGVNMHPGSGQPGPRPAPAPSGAYPSQRRWHYMQSMAPDGPYW